MKSTGPAALLWDNDGVLVDTEALYFRASREVLADAGIALTRDAFVEISLRRGASCFELAEAAGASQEQVDSMRIERDRRYLALVQAGPRVIDGVRETLDALAGMRMAVVTSSKRQHFEAIHAKSGLLDAFEFALTAEDYSKSKPHPAPYLAAAARLGVEPQSCLAIEDTERGLAAAAAAGMRCVAVPNELIRDGDFSAAWRVLDAIDHLPAAIAAWSSS